MPLGISHSVTGIPPENENFLRLNFYLSFDGTLSAVMVGN